MCDISDLLMDLDENVTRRHLLMSLLGATFRTCTAQSLEEIVLAICDFSGAISSAE